MPKSRKLILIELAWLFISFTATILFCFFILNWRYNNTMDIHLHDTVFIFPAIGILAPLFLLLTFLIFFFKEKLKRFTRTLPNVITLWSGLTLIVALSFFIKNLIKTSVTLDEGFTVYPPLSALGKTDFDIIIDPTANVISNVLLVLEFIILIALFYVTFQWGKNSGRQLIHDTSAKPWTNEAD
jgi:hypothetical protein